MAKTKAFLLAAGLGARLRPLTDWIPKCLVTVGGRPLLSWWLDALAGAGVGEAMINTHAGADHVSAFLERENARGPLRLAESFEPVLRGSAGAVAANPRWADDADDVILINADNVSEIDLRQLLSFHRGHGGAMTISLFRTPDPRSCGIATLDADSRVVRFTEKPARPESDLANAGVYALTAGCYREVAAMGAFDFGFDVLPRFVGRAMGWEMSGYHRDVGTPESLAAARRQAPGLASARAGATPGPRPAVFLDRDGTLIDHIPYLSRPDQVRLLPGAARGVRLLNMLGYPCVVVTNQSGIGRGYFTEQEFRRCNEEMARQLRSAGARLDGLYFCPAAPVSGDRTAIEHRDRKPGPGMLLRAAADLELDIARSWVVGDMVSDVLAGSNAGCKGGILLDRSGAEGGTAPDLAAAARIILRADHHLGLSGIHTWEDLRCVSC